MVDYICQYLSTVRERRVTPDVRPGYLRAQLPESAPEEPDSWDSIFGDIERIIMPGVRQVKAGWGPHHPGHLAGRLFTSALHCVTFKPSWAAVYVVVTAHSLGWKDRGWWALGPRWLPPSAQPGRPTTPGYLGKRAAAPGP